MNIYTTNKNTSINKYHSIMWYDLIYNLIVSYIISKDKVFLSVWLNDKDIEQTINKIDFIGIYI